MKSEEGVGYNESESILSANLIVHHGIANIIHNGVNPPRILRAVEEMGKIVLSCHHLQSLADLLQLPASLHVLGLALRLRSAGSPFQFTPSLFLSLLFINITRSDWFTE